MDIQALLLAMIVCAVIIVIAKCVVALVAPKEPVGLIIWTIVVVICLFVLYEAVLGHEFLGLTWGGRR